MPRQDTTGPRGNGPKRNNQGQPIPRRDSSGRGRGQSGTGRRRGR